LPGVELTATLKLCRRRARARLPEMAGAPDTAD
jgi:hypothetical protein